MLGELPYLIIGQQKSIALFFNRFNRPLLKGNHLLFGCAIHRIVILVFHHVMKTP